jgi:subtilisin family serine protease
MKHNRVLFPAALMLFVVGCERSGDRIAGTTSKVSAAATAGKGTIGVNVLLRAAPTAAQLAKLSSYGNIKDSIPELYVVLLDASASSLVAVQALPYVLAANPDAERKGAPVDAVRASDFAAGQNTWDLDAVNITSGPFSTTRAVPYDGSGVYIGVLDTGLLDSWRQYFPQERIATEYATSFGGGGAGGTNVSDQPNKWEHDQNSHGTHVTSTILGYQFGAARINGVAPLATVIPVKVLNQNGSGWSSVVAQGIVYIADLKAGPLAGHPVVINMSLGGPGLDAVEKAAIDYAISRGVILVASAGNEGDAGMGFPGAYGPVISVAASGWVGEWTAHPFGGLAGCNAVINWWRCGDVVESKVSGDFYITDFSSRQKAGQDLDVAAPGSWVVGPFQLQSGNISYFFLGGTSMASPHVAGVVALMAQKRSSLTASQAEAILESSAIPLRAGSRTIRNPDGSTSLMTWGNDAAGAGVVTADKALAATR